MLRVGDTIAVRGATSSSDGAFRVTGLAAGAYTVRLRALGFAPATRANIVLSASRPVADLDTIALTPVASQIAGQTVTADRVDVTLSPDRNSYSAKNMTTAAGGTAVDVLRNVPSVEVDANNQVSLRGNQSVVVQINGRSSPLKGEQLGNFLAQLPASAVKNVEVSTNPSAKNDPEGTAGIINIVLDQDTDLGWSGGFTGAAGTTGQANGSANIGRQSGPLSLFLSYGLYRNHQDTDGRSLLTNRETSAPAAVTAHVDGTNEPRWQNSTFRAEYLLAPHDALSFDGTLSGGIFSRGTVSYSTDLDQTGNVIGRFDQTNDLSSRYFTQDYAMAYRRTGDPGTRLFSTELHVTEATGRETTDLAGSVIAGGASTGAFAIPQEHDLSTGSWPTWTLQSDFTQPFGAKGTKLETGFKEIGRRTLNDFTAASPDSVTGDFVEVPDRATAFDYHEQIGAVYALFTQQVSTFQAQAGLRLEEATTQLALPDAAAASRLVDDHYASAFPSAILSYDFATGRQLKLSYSRRINRPNPFQLDPVEYRQDARNIFRGNVALRPEYTDAVEVGLQETASWGSAQLNPYVRHTIHAVRFIQTVDSTGTTYSTFDNVASTREVGADVNVTHNSGALSLLTGGNLSHYASDAGNLAGNPSTRAFIWSARVNATWKFSPTVDAQFMTNYRSAFATEGGTRTSFVYMNVALRRKLWNDHGSVTLRMQDPLNLLRFGTITSTAAATQSNIQSFGIRGLFVAVSRNFGQDLKLRPPDIQSEPPPTPPAA